MKVVSSAPGKVILFGEHAVVHGVTAVAAALSDLRIFVELVRILLYVINSNFETSFVLHLTGIID